LTRPWEISPFNETYSNYLSTSPPKNQTVCDDSRNVTELFYSLPNPTKIDN